MQIKKLFSLFKFNKYNNPLKTKVFIFCMLMVPMAGFLVFTVYANLGGVLLSLRGVHYQTNQEMYVGLANYKKFFDVFEILRYNVILKASIGYLPVVLFISLPISIICSFFLYKKIPFAKVIVVVLFLPNIIPLSLTAEFYRQLFDPVNGVLNKILNSIFGYTIDTAPSWLTDPRYSNSMLYLYTVWFGFGYNAILLWGAMSRIPQEIVESAELDGAGFFREFFSITIPIIWPTMSMVIVFICMTPFTVYMQPLLIAFDGQADTTTIALYTLQLLKNSFDPYYAAAVNILVAFVSIPFVLTVRKLLDKVFTVVEI